MAECQGKLLENEGLNDRKHFEKPASRIGYIERVIFQQLCEVVPRP